jgi:hypothetical protein
MQRIFKTRTFLGVMKKVGVSDAALANAVVELARGLHDGDLGGGLFKKRIPLAGKGKRGSVRTLIATRAGRHWFYLYGFKKNERADVTDQERAALKALAKDLLALNELELQIALQDGAIMEIGHDEG